MTTKLIGIALLASLLMLAPLAAADADSGNTTEGSGDRPDDAAWVEDCPPDMMCAYSETPKENGTRGPEDCEFCRDHQEQDCVDCLGAPAPADNTTWGTDCPPGVYCMVNGETDDPDDAGWVDCDGEVCAYDQEPGQGPASEHAEEAGGSALFFAAGAVALVGVAFLSTFRKE